jgi:hypothetical protein
LCLAQGGQHLHLLAKLPRDADARIWMGLAKKHAAFELKERGWQGKLWAKRGKEVRVRDRGHQRNVYGYILKHEEEGAWVWKWSKPVGAPATDGKPTDGKPTDGKPTDSRPWA